MVSSMSDLGGIFAVQAGSTYTCHVAQAQAPPQSASIPGIKFFTAPSITDQPSGTSASCSLPLCSMYLILGMYLASPLSCELGRVSNTCQQGPPLSRRP